MRIKITFSLLIALFAVSYSSLHAQTEEKKHEIGLQFSGINFDGFTTFNALYRKQIREHVYRRIRATFGNIDFQSNDNSRQLVFSANIAIGREKRKILDRKLAFYHGPEANVGLTFISSRSNGERTNIGAGFGYVLGLQHSFNDLWAMHMETLPAIQVNYVVGNAFVGEDLSIQLRGSSRVSLGVVRKF